jgi:DNA repair protein RecO (recombination protein O)
MGQTITLTGMVLSAAPVGEYDRRVMILTKERGKISAFARGARRPGNQLMAAVSPFSFGRFETYEGRSSYTVVKADITNYFRELAEHMENACYGFYFLELTDYYARENTEEIHMLKLLYQSLRALEKENLDNRLVRRIFELKTMVINGEYPNVFSCLSCRKEENLHWFSTKTGGTLCENCGGQAGQIFLDESVLYAMQYIITSTIEKLYTFTVSEAVLEKLEDIMNEYMAFYVERKFHALQILEENEGFAAQIIANSAKSGNQ